ncbi:dynein regulatory complex subunit 4 [Puma concolor]|uniref:Dynein regulatory complex subunit 4 n=1 Tax=Puma concolor TaxID=9696 RepID=A0A6P6HLJ9_PUMCO|nr:dynein regulatory complex subunit 4 [Puma concolor]
MRLGASGRSRLRLTPGRRKTCSTRATPGSAQRELLGTRLRRGEGLYRLAESREDLRGFARDRPSVAGRRCGLRRAGASVCRSRRESTTRAMAPKKKGKKGKTKATPIVDGFAPEDMSKEQKHSEEVTKMRNDFERQVREIEAKYDKKMKMLRDELDLRRKTEIHEVEERKNGQINMLMQRHEEAFTDIKNYYNDITLNNLALINSLKEQLEDMRKKEGHLEREMMEVSAQNKRLTDPLQKARDDVTEMQKKLGNYERDRQTLVRTKARLKVAEKELKDLQWEHEVLEQRFLKVQQERDELYRKFTAAILEVQQKVGFKNLVLERKLQALSAAVEKKEVQINEVLAASNLDPAALTLVSRKLENVLESKNNAIKDLQYELARVCKAHSDLLRTYEAKLLAFGIPLDNVGFKPLETAVIGQTLGQGPAGLVGTPT